MQRRRSRPFVRGRLRGHHAATQREARRGPSEAQRAPMTLQTTIASACSSCASSSSSATGAPIGHARCYAKPRSARSRHAGKFAQAARARKLNGAHLRAAAQHDVFSDLGLIEETTRYSTIDFPLPFVTRMMSTIPLCLGQYTTTSFSLSTMWKPGERDSTVRFCF
jgi:hypothetical protein